MAIVGLPEIIREMQQLLEPSEKTKAKHELAVKLETHIEEFGTYLSQTGSLHSQEAHRAEETLKSYIPVLTKQAHRDQDPDIECVACRIAHLLTKVHGTDEQPANFICDLGEDGIELLAEMMEMEDKENLLLLLKDETFHLSKLPEEYGALLLSQAVKHFHGRDLTEVFDLLLQKGANPFASDKKTCPYDQIYKRQDRELFHLCVKRRWKDFKKPEAWKKMNAHPYQPFFSEVFGKMKENHKKRLFENANIAWPKLLERMVKEQDLNFFSYLAIEGVPLQDLNRPERDQLLRKMVRDPASLHFLEASLKALSPLKNGDKISNPAMGNYLREAVRANNLLSWKMLLEYGAEPSRWSSGDRLSIFRQIVDTGRYNFLYALLDQCSWISPEQILNWLPYGSAERETAQMMLENYVNRKMVA
ncbi:MAG: hypothetical protein LLG04_04080 [Parachlamydia sp.]|nr:hypothetical protein [Parachlamydia sp.]